jgi:hypothetical protein
LSGDSFRIIDIAQSRILPQLETLDLSCTRLRAVEPELQALRAHPSCQHLQRFDISNVWG